MTRDAQSPGPRNAGSGLGRAGWGWLVAAVLLVLLVSVWRVLPMLGSSRAVGNGRNVSTYGFDLSAARVPTERIVAAGFPRDGVPALDAPPVMRATEVAAFNETHRGHYLVDEDQVIGLSIGGEARAYPLRVLNWHEVVNDELAGVPIAVTFHPLCDSSVVFDRRVDGRVLEFGVSGLLYNSNLLMYDRGREPGDESLWSQLQGRAISGPEAGSATVLTTLPFSLVRWGVWKRLHPESTVPRPAQERLRRYERDPYGNYLRTGKLRFPVEPLPQEADPAPMDRMLIVTVGGERRILSLREVAASGFASRLPDGVTVELEDAGSRPSVVVDERAGVLPMFSLWFAWYSQHPESARSELIGWKP